MLQAVILVGLSLRVAAAEAPASRLQALAFHLADVRLIEDADSHFFQAQELNTQYLRYLEPDRLLYNFRMIAGLPPAGPGGTATPYGGWIAPTGRFELVNGHFTGHFLSALAFTAASSGNAEIFTKSHYLVAELGKCQDAWCKKNASECGYLSAYHISQIYALEEHQGGTWATYYTLHKIMAGLLDQYENLGNERALDILVKMANFVKGRVDHLLAEKGWGWWEQCLRVESGGMNEVAFNLYAITNDPAHKTLGDYFYKAEFMDPLAKSVEYALTGQHANTHLPAIIGVARGWELTGNSTLHSVTQFFYDILTKHYTYAATGGSNEGELWLYPDQLGTAIATRPGHDSAGYHTEESCTQYNVLKIVRHLFKWAPSAALGDDYEHKINNGVLGIQKPTEVGAMVYMTPLGNGVSRAQANWGEGWGSANNSFWCCYGTAVESFGKLADSLYFHQELPGAAKQIWVVQYVSSVVRWRAAGLNLTQSVSYDYSGSMPVLHSKITVSNLFSTSSGDDQAAVFEDVVVTLRIPGWAVNTTASTSRVSLNGEPVVKGVLRSGSLLQIKAAFKPGDVIACKFGMAPRFEKINDKRMAYDTVGSIHVGPFLLVGMSNGSYALKADVKEIGQWLTMTPGRMEFTAKAPDGSSSFQMVPLNRVVDETYTAHFNISLSATQCLCGDADSCSDGAGRTRAGTKFLLLNASSLVAIGGADVKEGTIRSGNPGMVSAVVMKSPFDGTGTITGIKLSYSYTIGYNSAPGRRGAQIGLAFHPNMDLGQCGSPSSVRDPDAKQLYTSPEYLEPQYDKTHEYSAPINVSLSGLALDVAQPGARLGLTFVDNDHNMQVLLPIRVEIEWKAEAHEHHIHYQ